MTSHSQTPPELETMLFESDDDGIGTLTLNRPDAFNAMSPEMIAELPTIFSWLADEADLRALIVTGAGKAFCSGGDVNWFRKGVEDENVDLPASVRRAADVLHQGIVDLRRIPFSVVGAINGPAAGAGFSLALACDVRIAAEGAFFAPASGRIGASPDGGLTSFLSRLVGPGRALELLLEDPNMSAEDALVERIVGEVVPAEELAARAREKARKLGAMAPHYVRNAKALTAISIETPLAEHLQLERHGIADSMATEDLRNGVAAFLSGEVPEFTGL
jgi:2-(1,2-epoxy-1,2-dihydrophenyl)acetyl-CoA isomerase